MDVGICWSSGISGLHITGERQAQLAKPFLDLGGRPPLRFFRRACNCLKYSRPRLAISFPPFRPSVMAAGSFLFGKIQRVI